MAVVRWLAAIALLLFGVMDPLSSWPILVWPQVTRGIGQSAQETGIPHAFGVLTCETLEQAISFFKKYSLAAIGLAPFGPLDLNRASPGYGSITATPKPLRPPCP